ncbi:hypothetical protein [Flavobacterium turcicum]|uniref:Lipoprotein n=1 Tax=Flavobacterium turcicum TaxID=2764718 RepID=A0ABR7JC72_9FLAO|nr:hypothetical protein [Flavobacterium turcicum]MBC5861953.1 hypothetical protein [Flavobacterium turcicum]NHL00684.1 hypothetical protein [Flavobacterium turcicum]
MKNSIISFFYLLMIIVFISSCCRSNDFENQWFSLNSKLKINDNNTFEFERFSSISSSISKGNWVVVNDTLILNSFQNNLCYFYENFKLEPSKNNNNYKILKSNKDCQPNQGYVIFNNEKFYLKDSILIHKTEIINHNSKLRTIYNFTRNNINKYP